MIFARTQVNLYLSFRPSIGSVAAMAWFMQARMKKVGTCYDLSKQDVNQELHKGQVLIIRANENNETATLAVSLINGPSFWRPLIIPMH